jgi:hypothetical protein
MYRSLVGSLQYLATGVRVDEVYIIHVLAQYVADQENCHMKIASRVLSYNAQTPNMGLGYRVKEETGSDIVVVKIYWNANVGRPETNKNTMQENTNMSCNGTKGK